jgi:hypothetical protein
MRYKEMCIYRTVCIIKSIIKIKTTNEAQNE